MARRATGPVLTRVIRVTWPPTRTRRGFTVTQAVPGEQINHVDILWHYTQELTAEMRARGAVVAELEWTCEPWG